MVVAVVVTLVVVPVVSLAMAVAVAVVQDVPMVLPGVALKVAEVVDVAPTSMWMTNPPSPLWASNTYTHFSRLMTVQAVDGARKFLQV